MGTFVRLLRLDLRLQARSFLYPATLVSTAMICAFIVLLPVRPLPPKLTVFFVFMDPATIGLSFVGAMVLMEKAHGTVFALGVTPAKVSAYVGAKMVSLTLLTIASGLVVVRVATAAAFDVLQPLIAVTLCSAVTVLIGLFCVARAASMNQLLVILLGVTTLLYLPLLIHFGALPSPFSAPVALIPSYAMLVMLEAAIDPASVSPPAHVAAALYLGAWIGIGWRQVLREFESAIITEGR